MPIDERLGDAWRKLPRELADAAVFLTRLPLGRWLGITTEPASLTSAARVFPLVGAAIGLIVGIALAIAVGLHLPPLAAGALAVMASLVLTGALHEDGLADTSDGFGGGTTALARLEIMRDSRIGTYGAAALTLTLLLRCALLAGIAAVSPYLAALALIAAESASRAALVRAWHDLPPARNDGLSAGSGRPDAEAMAVALIIAAIVLFLVVLPAFGLWAFLWVIVLAIGATLAVTALCRAMIGGQTGDTLGATQQIVAITMLTVLAIFV